MTATASAKKTVVLQPYCKLTNDSWAALIILLPALLGFAVNLYNCWKFLKSRRVRGSFTYLWTSRCFANAIVLLIFMTYTSPSIFCNRQVPNKQIGYFIANSTGTFYLTVLFVQVLLAVHRFFASISVQAFKLVSSTRATIVQLAIVWFIGIFNTAEWVTMDCKYWFDVPWWSWEDDCAEWLTEWTTPIPVKVTIATVVVLNATTFGRLYVIQRTKKYLMSDSRLKHNFRLLWQGTVHDSFFFIDIINQYYTSTIYDTKWWYLLCYSVSWQWAHILDGLAILLLNEDLRSPVFGMFKKKKKSTSTHRAFTVLYNSRVDDIRMRHS